MRLDPIYVLGPPPPANTPTRRRFFGVVVTAFAAGLGGGYLCGGIGTAKPVEANGDAPLVAWARRLAAPGTSDAELLEHAEAFLQVVHLHAPAAGDVLWRGVERIVEATLADARHAEPAARRLLARRLAALLVEHRGSGDLARHLARLEEIAR